jgi:hypothetical protein
MMSHRDSLLLAALVLGFHCQRVVSLALYRSTAAPRFDTFAENVVGFWTLASGSASVSAEVTEVMRSCGGAVQGLRECPLPSNMLHNGDAGVYLNRANDGFVYWNCGSYSLGPVKLPMNGEKRNDTTELYFLSSIQLDKNERMVLECRLEKSGITEPTAYLLQKRASQTSQVETCASRLVNLEVSPHLSTQSGLDNLIDWHQHLKCRTTVPGAAWNLKRASWEQATVQVDATADATVQASLADSETLPRYTATIEHFLNGNDNDGTTPIATTFTVVHAASGRVWSISREYTSSGDLEAVLFQSGQKRADAALTNTR